MLSIVVGWVALAAMWWFVFRDRSRGKGEKDRSDVSQAGGPTGNWCVEQLAASDGSEAHHVSVELLMRSS